MEQICKTSNLFCNLHCYFYGGRFW